MITRSDTAGLCLALVPAVLLTKRKLKSYSLFRDIYMYDSLYYRNCGGLLRKSVVYDISSRAWVHLYQRKYNLLYTFLNTRGMKYSY